MGTSASFIYQGPGTKTVRLRVRDGGGQTGDVVHQFEVTASPPLDTTPPDTTITAGPSGTVSTGGASFGFSSTETGSSFECRLDGGSWASCSSPKAYSSLTNGSHTFDVRAKDPSGNVDASPASRSWTVSVSTGGAGCDSTVSTTAAIQSAASSVANEGKVVCVADGSYGSVTLSGSHSTKVTLKAQNKGRATLANVVMQNVSGLRVENFRITGKTSHSGNAANIEVVGNDIGGGPSNGFTLTCGANNWLIENNYIHDISWTGNFGDGYGMYVYGGCDKQVKIRYNTFTRTAADAMELGRIANFEIVGNVIDDVKCPGDCSVTHTDALMIWDRSHNGLVKDNRITDSIDFLLSPDGSNITVQNNLIARMGSFCIDAHPNGSSGNVVSTNYVFRQNTIWTCTWDGLQISGALTSGHGGNVLDRNIIKNVSCATSAIWSIADHNLLGSGSCFGGTNVFNFAPTFQDTVNYLPTNLPSGYSDAGYRPAPAGHTP
jgi:hypothetical protein